MSDPQNASNEIRPSAGDVAPASTSAAVGALHQERRQVEKLIERAILVAVHLPESRVDRRDPLGELRALAQTAGARVVGEMLQNRQRPESGTYLGKGKLEELRCVRDELNATLVIFDNDLSPAQIRNIEELVNCRVIDRSELILDIFAGRALTAAAKLQVEMAQLEYTYPRLRAMWSHLGQVTGGAPIGIGTRGPGETQIETDRRLVQRRKTVLRKRLNEVHERRVREVEQRRSQHFSACLVGYTNAGKSTLFNVLTAPFGGGGAYADNRLFATLTTRTRRWVVGSDGCRDEILLSDTVGFVRDLPHHLVASFRATLEEAIYADLLLIVIDISDPMAQLQYQIVQETLAGLLDERRERLAPTQEHDDAPNEQSDGRVGHDSSSTRKSPAPESGWMDGRTGVEAPGAAGPTPLARRQLLILNKADRLEDESEIAVWHQMHPEAIVVSAYTGRGIEELRQAVHERIFGRMFDVSLYVPYSLAKAVIFIESHGRLLDERAYDDRGVRLRVRLTRPHLDQLRAMGVRIDEAIDS